MLDDPGPGRFVRELTLGLVRQDDNHYDDACEVLARRLRPRLESLYIGDYTTDECELNWTTIVAPGSLWAALPRLRTLTLRAGEIELEELDLPELREFETITGGLSGDALTTIANAAWPELRRLSIQVGLQGQGATRDVDLLTPLLDAQAVPQLEHFGVLNCEFTDELCLRLVRSRLLPQLRSVDLSMGTMSMAGAQALAAAASSLRKLEFIDVDDNYLPDQARDLLERIGPEIRFGEQREEDGGQRYASAFE